MIGYIGVYFYLYKESLIGVFFMYGHLWYRPN